MHPYSSIQTHKWLLINELINIWLFCTCMVFILSPARGLALAIYINYQDRRHIYAHRVTIWTWSVIGVCMYGSTSSKFIGSTYIQCTPPRSIGRNWWTAKLLLVLRKGIHIDILLVSYYVRFGRKDLTLPSVQKNVYIWWLIGLSIARFDNYSPGKTIDSSGFWKN